MGICGDLWGFVGYVGSGIWIYVKSVNHMVSVGDMWDLWGDLWGICGVCGGYVGSVGIGGGYIGM